MMAMASEKELVLNEAMQNHAMLLYKVSYTEAV